MVDFVLEGAGEQLGAFELDGLAVEILGADADFGGARDFVANVGEAEAAFFLDLLPFSVHDLRIDEDDFVLGLLLIADVDDGDALADADLGAARPMPTALYMDSNMSAASARSSSLNSATGSVGRCRMGSGYVTMARIMARTRQ